MYQYVFFLKKFNKDTQISSKVQFIEHTGYANATNKNSFYFLILLRPIEYLIHNKNPLFNLFD